MELSEAEADLAEQLEAEATGREDNSVCSCMTVKRGVLLGDKMDRTWGLFRWGFLKEKASVIPGFLRGATEDMEVVVCER